MPPDLEVYSFDLRGYIHHLEEALTTAEVKERSDGLNAIDP